MPVAHSLLCLIWFKLRSQARSGAGTGTKACSRRPGCHFACNSAASCSCEGCWRCQSGENHASHYHVLLPSPLYSFGIGVNCFLAMQEDLLTELLQKNGGKGQLLLLLWI